MMQIARESVRLCSRSTTTVVPRTLIRHAPRRGCYGITSTNAATRCTPPIASSRCHYYFTDADRVKKSDPYAALGLEWGATAMEIKDAYRALARKLHPDVSQLEPSAALDEFRIVREAYDKLMNNKNAGSSPHRTDLWEEWSFAIWRNGDLIAQERTDVAGTMRKRPATPAESMKRKKWGMASLGHPDGRGASVGRRAEYLAGGDGERRAATTRSSTVGTGRSKWVQRKEFRPWNPEEGKLKGASQYRRSRNAADENRESDKDGKS